MTKKLPTQDIANELESASVFFQRPEPPQAKPTTPASEPLSTSTSSGDEPRPSSAPQQGSPQAISSQPEATNEPSNDPSKQRINARAVERTKVRHTFDIFQDQLASLRKFQIAREETLGKRYLLGELVQEALDLFIAKERNNDQTFVPTK